MKKVKWRWILYYVFLVCLFIVMSFAAFFFLYLLILNGRETISPYTLELDPPGDDILFVGVMLCIPSFLILSLSVIYFIKSLKDSQGKRMLAHFIIAIVSAPPFGVLVLWILLAMAEYFQ